jgi:hypothetical protein
MALQRISIGFLAAPPIALRVEDAELDRLRQALPSGEWHDLQAEDGNVTINLSQVVYLRTDREEHRVGFGISA